MTQSDGDALLARLKASVGREVVYHAPEPIGRASIRQYALAIGDANPLYKDTEAARQAGLRDVMAPPTFVCDSWQYIDSDIDERGELLGRGMLRDFGGLRAGNDYEFFRPVHPDDVLTVHWKVKDVYEKAGRAGRMVFQELEVTYTNQRSELLARSVEIMFHRLPAAAR